MAQLWFCRALLGLAGLGARSRPAPCVSNLGPASSQACSSQGNSKAQEVTSNPASPFTVSVRFLSTHVPLAEASHVIQPSVSGEGNCAVRGSPGESPGKGHELPVQKRSEELGSMTQLTLRNDIIAPRVSKRSAGFKTLSFRVNHVALLLQKHN